MKLKIKTWNRFWEDYYEHPKRRDWHKHFLWFPKRFSQTEVLWLCFVWRRVHPLWIYTSGPYNDFLKWQYSRAENPNELPW